MKNKLFIFLTAFLAIVLLGLSSCKKKELIDQGPDINNKISEKSNVAASDMYGSAPRNKGDEIPSGQYIVEYIKAVFLNSVEYHAYQENPRVGPQQKYAAERTKNRTSDFSEVLTRNGRQIRPEDVNKINLFTSQMTSFPFMYGKDGPEEQMRAQLQAFLYSMQNCLWQAGIDKQSKPRFLVFGWGEPSGFGTIYLPQINAPGTAELIDSLLVLARKAMDLNR